MVSDMQAVRQAGGVLMDAQTNKTVRSVANHLFEGGQFVQILASAELSTPEALDWAETLIKQKRAELAYQTHRDPAQLKRDVDAIMAAMEMDGIPQSADIPAADQEK